MSERIPSRFRAYSRFVLNRLLPTKIIEIDGFKFRYPRRGTPPHDPIVFGEGVEFHQRVRGIEGQTAFDVGANIGSYTLQLSRKFREVLAFEPNWADCDLLRSNLGINRVRNVRVFQLALSDSVGTKPLYVRGGGATSLDSEHYGLGYDGVRYVRTARLDDFLSIVKELDFLKIDAEGHERQILAGGGELINSFRPTVAMEVHRGVLPKNGSCNCEVCGALRSLGYRIQIIGEAASVGRVHWVWGLPIKVS